MWYGPILRGFLGLLTNPGQVGPVEGSSIFVSMYETTYGVSETRGVWHMAHKLVIVGGVAGGATAAARARRLNEHAEIVLFERGEHISFANCGLPYYIGGVIEDRENLLVTTRESFMTRYRVNVRTRCEVVAIDKEQKEVRVRDLVSGEQLVESYDKLILAPGAEPVKPPIPGIDLDGILHLRNIPDSDRIKARVSRQTPESAVVVGGGFIGLEMAENLVCRGVNTTIVEMADQVIAPLDREMAAVVHAHLRKQGVVLELGQRVAAFQSTTNGLAVVTAQGREIPCNMVILSIGVAPENKLAKGAGLELGERGHIRVDAAMTTSDPHIYAVGDAVEIRDLVTGFPTAVALAGPANKQGRIAADNAMGRRSLYTGALGTSIVKVFKQTIAATGASKKTLEALGIPYMESYTHSGSHASYYPDPSPMAIKLLFSPGNGRILGAQIVGEKGVDKRIDVLATAIHGTMTVFDLEELELAYAPPYSSAKDPVNIAGYVAANIIQGDMDIVHWHELAERQEKGAVLVDLRSIEEVEASGIIPGALHIPLEDLRSSLDRLDQEKEYIPYCAVGMRGYLAHRILIQNGFESRNLSGGYRTFLGAGEQIMQESPEVKLWLSE
jgi:NADPH-dependent 2,4-dienoyl-CoA reductase/sulfur reductase-like enzyme/rhodanese-related sulfurtransferase